MVLSGILDQLAQLSLNIVETLGYPGVFVLMVLESMVFPVPSEAVLPPAGWLAFEGKMNLGLALLVATAGTIVGSLLSYAMGAYGVRPLLERYGKYIFVTPHHIEVTHSFFERRGGGLTIFLARFVPVVRHLISIPAGSARMPLGTFTLATLAGGAAWNFILLYAGYKLGENWHRVTEYVEAAKLPILIVTSVIVLTAAGVWWMKRRAKGATDAR